MDQTDIVVNSVKALNKPIIEIEASNSKKYTCDLADFSKVKCFPVDQKQWEDLSITGQGFNISWGTRFEIHVLQAIDCATSETNIRLQA